MIYTEAQLQAIIHSIYEGDTSTPSSTDDDYLVRRNFINMGIAHWENWRGVEWQELYTTLDDTNAGADTTVSTGDTQSNCPTDFVRTVGFIRLVDSSGDAVTYTEVKPSEAQVYVISNSNARVYWITGKPGAYKINWYPAISASDNGKSIKYPFYKRAVLMTATTDIPDASDHTFLVHYVLSWLYKEEDAGRSREQLDICNNIINAMKLKNDMNKAYQDGGVFDKLSSGFGL